MHIYHIIFSIRKNAKIVVYLDFYAKMFAPRFFIYWTSLVVFTFLPYFKDLRPNSLAYFWGSIFGLTDDLFFSFAISMKNHQKRQKFGRNWCTKNMSKKLMDKYSILCNNGSIKETGEFGLRMPLILC